MKQLPTCLLLLMCALLVPAPRALSQGTITFDGAPEQPPGTGALISYYSEAGMSFYPIYGTYFYSFTRTGSGIPFYPDNGTAYLQAMMGDSLQFSFNDWTPFNLISVDLAEYSTVVPDAVTLSFVGYRPDGGSVTQTFRTDGIIDGTGPLPDFETFYFSPEFSGLRQVYIYTAGWSLDNLVVSVPEPGTGSLLLLGLAGLVAARRRRSERRDAKPQRKTP